MAQIWGQHDGSLKVFKNMWVKWNAYCASRQANRPHFASLPGWCIWTMGHFKMVYRVRNWTLKIPLFECGGTRNMAMYKYYVCMGVGAGVDVLTISNHGPWGCSCAYAWMHGVWKKDNGNWPNDLRDQRKWCLNGAGGEKWVLIIQLIWKISLIYCCMISRGLPGFFRAQFLAFHFIRCLNVNYQFTQLMWASAFNCCQAYMHPILLY